MNSLTDKWISFDFSNCMIVDNFSILSTKYLVQKCNEFLYEGVSVPKRCENFKDVFNI